MLDREPAGEFRLKRRFFFRDAAHHRGPRPAYEFPAERCECLRRTDGVHFHAAVAEIFDVACKAQPFGRALRKITVAHTLNHSGYVIAPDSASVLHGRFGPQAANPRFYQTLASHNRK
jgi:hypothetical protein